MLRLAIGRALLWFIEPAEAERDRPIRDRSIARRRAFEEKLQPIGSEREATTMAFHDADARLRAQLDQRRSADFSLASAADNRV